MQAKILIIDIETAPHMAYVWGAWKNNIGQNQWLKKGYIMSFVAKWLGHEEIIYIENRKDDDSKIVAKLFELLDEADIVVAHNGDKFDLPVILGRGLVHGLRPPSPYFTVDTCRIARRRFRFATNSLANLAEELGLDHQKDGHDKFPGFELWVECIKGNDEAWAEMRKYNEQDVIVLEELYLAMRPYIDNHPNVVRETEEGKVHCPKCGSTNIQFRGYYYTKMGLCYRRFVCLDCGGWGRMRYAEKDRIGNNGRNAV
jgi:DNA polymerase elongation subunit (family B)